HKKKTDTSLYPLLVCVPSVDFTLVLCFTLCQFFHLSRALQDPVGHVGSAKHPCKFPHGSFFIKKGDIRSDGIPVRLLFDQEMAVRRCRDLGQVGNTDDLTALSDQPQLLPDLSCSDP